MFKNDLNFVMEKFVLGIDIGGTTTCIGAITNKGRILAERSFPTVAQESVNQFLNNLNFGIKEVLDVIEDCELVGIGVGAPGINTANGHIEYAANLSWDQAINIKIYLSNLHHVPVEVTNDANLPAIGEKLFGNAKNMRDFMTISLGTGLGCGIVANGRLLEGYQGLAGEIGHMIVKENGRECGCGRRGCLETYVSANGLKRTVYKLLADNHFHSSLLGKISYNSLTAHYVAEAARMGDAIALKAFDYTGKILGSALADAVTITNPEAIFLVGGLAKSGALLFAAAQKAFDEKLLKNMGDKLRLMPSALPIDKLPLLGAGALLWNSLNRQVSNDSSYNMNLFN